MKVFMGAIVLFVLGFITYVTLMGFGLVLHVVFNLLPWWHILIGTVVGTGLVVSHFWSKIQ